MFGPLFIGGKITNDNIEAQAQSMFSEGLRISGFDKRPLLTNVRLDADSGSAEQRFYPDTDLVVDRGTTTWKIKKDRQDDCEGGIIIVQIGYSQQSPEEIEKAPEGAKFKYVGNGFYFRVKFDEFIAANPVDDYSVWFTPIVVEAQAQAE